MPPGRIAQPRFAGGGPLAAPSRKKKRTAKSASLASYGGRRQAAEGAGNPNPWKRRIRNLTIGLSLLSVTLGGALEYGRNAVFRNEMFGPYGAWGNPLAKVEGGERHEITPPDTLAEFAQYPQKTLWGTGNLLNQSEAMREIDSLRADFNRLESSYAASIAAGGDSSMALGTLSKGLDLFNGALPYRASLAGQPQKLAQHDLLISRFANHPDVRFTFIDTDDKAYAMDPSTRYLIAATLMDLMHNRWDLVEGHLIEKNAPLDFLQIRGPRNKPGTAGSYTAGSDDIILVADTSKFWGNFAQGRPVTPITHEAAGHGLIYERDGWIARNLLRVSLDDGYLEGLSREECEVIDAEYSRLRKIFMEKINDMHLEGLPGYAFQVGSVENSIRMSDTSEFIPEMIELFQAEPESLYQVSSPIYDLLKKYFKVDPLNGWRDLP